MEIIDLHCDALLKLAEGKGKLSFTDSPELNINVEKLFEGNVKVQLFAIWVDPDIKYDHKFQAALEQANLFHREVIGKNAQMKHLKNWADLWTLQDGEIGAMLTLEGVDAIGDDLTKYSILHELGVRSVGLTWNNANLAADGIGEPRGGGLTLFGKELVKYNNENGILTDVSHLSEQAFWDVLELARYPLATHSNSRTYCSHRRNLTDDQAKGMFEKGGLVGVVYCPYFASDAPTANIDDLLRHIDHFASLGGIKQICLGSDFDGISSHIIGLEDASKSQNLINELLKRYKEEEVRGFANENFLNYIKRHFG